MRRRNCGATNLERASEIRHEARSEFLCSSHQVSSYPHLLYLEDHFNPPIRDRRVKVSSPRYEVPSCSSARSLTTLSSRNILVGQERVGIRHHNRVATMDPRMLLDPKAALKKKKSGQPGMLLLRELYLLIQIILTPTLNRTSQTRLHLPRQGHHRYLTGCAHLMFFVIYLSLTHTI